MNDNGMIRDASAGDAIGPTPLQHTIVKVIGTMMHKPQQTAHDKEVALAVLVSTAHVDEDWEFRSAHNSVLDMGQDGQPTRAARGPGRRSPPR
jgi:hypothetical protein